MPLGGNTIVLSAGRDLREYLRWLYYFRLRVNFALFRLVVVQASSRERGLWSRLSTRGRIFIAHTDAHVMGRMRPGSGSVGLRLDCIAGWL